MNTERLAAIQARVGAATPGPWYADRDEPGDVAAVVAYAHNDGITIGTYVADVVEADGDAEFIAAAPSDVAFLLAELRQRDEALWRVERLAARWATLADGDRYYARHILAALDDRT